MAENKKMTKVDYFMAIMAETQNPEIQAFCEHEISLLKNKAEKAQGRTSKEKIENDRLRAAILETLAEVGVPMTVSELMNRCPALEGAKNQKVTGLLTTLAQDHGTGEVFRFVEKRVAYYSLPQTEE